MRRYKLAIHILAILSVFDFVLVLAAPVPVQGVHEACVDVADGVEDVIIVSGKRGEEGQDPLTQASPDQGSTSLQLSTSSLQGSPPTSDYASGVHQETRDSIQVPSFTSGEMQRPPYALGGTELPWYPSDDTEPHLLTQTYPWTLNTEIGLATPSASESESSGEIPPAKPESLFSKLASKSKSFFKKLARISKSLFGKMVNPNLQIH